MDNFPQFKLFSGLKYSVIPHNFDPRFGTILVRNIYTITTGHSTTKGALQKAPEKNPGVTVRGYEGLNLMYAIGLLTNIDS